MPDVFLNLDSGNIEPEPATSTEHYITRWKHPEKGWLTSTMPKRPTLEQAQKQFDHDRDYFYDDIEIQLVKVSEEIITTGKGLSKRGRAAS
jgi:hypothetical protein